MGFKESAEFIKDLHMVLKKHGMSAISGPPEKIIKTTNHLQGNYFFFTKGDKKYFVEGGENIIFEKSITIKLNKNRYKQENNEDDGN